MSTMHKAELAVAQGRVKVNRDRSYDVTNAGGIVHVVRIFHNPGGFLDGKCDCLAGSYDQPCHHVAAALIFQTDVSTRERAWADALHHLRTLVTVLEDEGIPSDTDAEDTMIAALHRGLDEIDTAFDIDKES